MPLDKQLHVSRRELLLSGAASVAGTALAPAQAQPLPTSAPSIAKVNFQVDGQHRRMAGASTHASRWPL